MCVPAFEGILKCLQAIQFEVSEAAQQMGSFMWKVDSQGSPNANWKLP